jgi:hypothetical protein
MKGLPDDPSRCRVCGGPLEQPRVGRKRKFCSKSCARKDERRRAADSLRVSPRSEATSPRAETVSPRPEEASPRENDEAHLPWWEVERLGLGSGGYWVGSERPPWRSCQSLSGDGWEGELSL